MIIKDLKCFKNFTNIYILFYYLQILLTPSRPSFISTKVQFISHNSTSSSLIQESNSAFTKFQLILFLT